MLLLGVVALTLSAFVLPEQLYPWLSLASGLLGFESKAWASSSACSALNDST